MVTYYVKLNESYTITATAECNVYNASGVLIATCPANSSINVKAATAKLKLSDDNAAIKKAVSESGGGTSEECEQHIANTDIHTTAIEKANCLNHIANSDVHVTRDDKTKIANAAQLTSANTFTKKTTFKNGVDIYSGTFQCDVLAKFDAAFILNGTSARKITMVSDGNYYGDDLLNKTECDSLYAPKTYSTPNAILITDASGNITASTVISVSELNTLNNNVTNLATKLADLESRLAALES